MTKQMPADELRERLTKAAERIAEMRDKDLAKASSCLPDMKGYHQGAAAAAMLALDALHIWTRGEFGEPFHTQPNWFADTEVAS